MKWMFAIVALALLAGCASRHELPSGDRFPEPDRWWLAGGNGE
jgi:hypothetical protein